MMGAETEEYKFVMVGGELCLDFANTVGGIMDEQQEEHLHSYADLMRWASESGAIDEVTFGALDEAANENPQEAEHTLEQARAFRHALYGIFSAVAAERQAPVTDMQALNSMLERALAHRTVRQDDTGFVWEWGGGGGNHVELDRVLWPVARSAADLLIEGSLARVRQCADDSCGWLFLDTSKNRSRRWCVMSDCGNRAKARRHYHRRRATE